MSIFNSVYALWCKKNIYLKREFEYSGHANSVWFVILCENGDMTIGCKGVKGRETDVVKSGSVVFVFGVGHKSVP
jgi:uncharacterized protein YjlB